ncbi:MAG: MFS transporter [Phenylobacterium sp.]
MSAEATAEGAVTPTALPDRQRNQVLTYLGVLALLVGFGSPSGGLIDVPITFLLKNKLHLQPHEVANFRLAAAAPLYVAFLFGFARDRWNLFGRKDRALLMLFGTICAATYAAFAFAPPTYWMLMAAVVLCTVAYSFSHAAQQGLASQIGQQHVMTGQVSTIWNVFLVLPYLVTYLAGGILSQSLEGREAGMAARILFLVGAGVMAAVALYAAWRPKVVFDNLHAEKDAGSAFGDLKRIARHWPVYPALGCWFLFSFAPGSGTPLQYYLQNTLHATDTQWGEWNALFAGSFIPTTLLFGYLCRKVSLRKLLIWGTVAAVPQMVPLYFIHSIDQGLVAAIVIGLLGGVASCAYVAFIIRSCPPGLQGTTVMMMTSLYWVAVRFGDVLGTRLYEGAGGFGACVVAITVVYALILPLVLLAPRALIDSPDA